MTQQTQSHGVAPQQFSLLLLLSLFCFAGSAAAEMINVLSLDASRNLGGRSEDFVGGLLYASFRSDLALNTNFGMGGTVSTDVNFLTPVNTLTSSNLATANVLIWSQRSAPSAPEKSAIASFVNGGGSLMVISDASFGFVDLLGGNTAKTLSTFTSQTGSYVNSNTPMTSGLFGNVANVSNVLPGASFRLVSDNGGNEGPLNANATTGIVDNFGNAIAVTGVLGLGRIAIFGDDDIFLVYGHNSQNPIAAKNTFAWLAAGSVTAVPEPSSIALMAIAIIPIARRWRRKSSGSGTVIAQ